MPNIIFWYIIIVNNHHIPNNLFVVKNCERLTLRPINICLCETTNRV